MVLIATGIIRTIDFYLKLF